MGISRDEMNDLRGWKRESDMTDDFNLALAERLCIASLSEDGIEWPTLAEWVKKLHRERMRNTLAALPLSAAALNALEKGEAVVVPERRTREMLNAHRAAYSLAPITDSHWQAITDQRRLGPSTGDTDRAWTAQLAASPYAKEKKDG